MKRFRRYLQGDEKRIAVRPDMLAEYEAMGSRVHDGPKWCLVDGDVVLGIGGLAYDEDDDSWDLWGLAGQGLTRWHWGRIARHVRGLIREARLTGGRVWVRASPCDGAEAFIRRLGFQAAGGKGVFYV